MNKTKAYILILCALLSVLCFAACVSDSMTPLPADSAAESTAPEDSVTDIDLSEAVADSSGYYSITAAGTYRLFSESSVGVRVSVKNTESVQLILDGAGIYNEKGAAIYIESAKSTVITLADGSENHLADGCGYVAARGDEPNACLFSKDDLTVTGNGTLTVYGQCNNGIGTKDRLEINSGNITVTAPKNAVKGNDGITVTGGKIEISGCKDGIKSNDVSESGSGYVNILGGDINIKCADDGVQAGSITVKDCSLFIEAGDKQINASGNSDIADGCLS